jgi:hypothetical protein
MVVRAAVARGLNNALVYIEQRSRLILVHFILSRLGRLTLEMQRTFRDSRGRE